MLHFAAKPLLSFEKFLAACQGLIPEEDIGILGLSSLNQGQGESALPVFKKWRAFDASLRNELAKIRALHRREGPLKYLRQEGYSEPSIAHTAMSALRNPSILEAERFLDSVRWQFLDELAVGHYFDLDCLVIYAHKLLLLEKWARIDSADKPALLEEVLGKG